MGTSSALMMPLRMILRCVLRLIHLMSSQVRSFLIWCTKERSRLSMFRILNLQPSSLKSSSCTFGWNCTRSSRLRLPKIWVSTVIAKALKPDFSASRITSKVYSAFFMKYSCITLRPVGLTFATSPGRVVVSMLSPQAVFCSKASRAVMSSPCGWRSFCMAKGAIPKGIPTSSPRILVAMERLLISTSTRGCRQMSEKAEMFFFRVTQSSLPEMKQPQTSEGSRLSAIA